MPRYYFDCFDGVGFHEDVNGMELRQPAEVPDHAASLACELLSEVTDSVGARAVSVMVRSADGDRLYIANCSFHGFLTAPGAETD